MTSPQWAAAVEAIYVWHRDNAAELVPSADIHDALDAALPHLERHFRAQFAEEMERCAETLDVSAVGGLGGIEKNAIKYAARVLREKK